MTRSKFNVFLTIDGVRTHVGHTFANNSAMKLGKSALRDTRTGAWDIKGHESHVGYLVLAQGERSALIEAIEEV